MINVGIYLSQCPLPSICIVEKTEDYHKRQFPSEMVPTTAIANQLVLIDVYDNDVVYTSDTDQVVPLDLLLK